MHIAQAIKQASIKQLLALTLTDYWEQTECAAQSEWRQLSVWSRRMHTRGSDVYLFLFIFDDHCVICISREGKHAASVRCHSCSGCERTRTLEKTFLKREKPARQQRFERRTLKTAATLKLESSRTLCCKASWIRLPQAPRESRPCKKKKKKKSKMQDRQKQSKRKE